MYVDVKALLSVTAPPAPLVGGRAARVLLVLLVRLEAVHCDVDLPVPYLQFEEFGSLFQHQVGAIVRRCEGRQLAALPDVHHLGLL